MIGYVGSTGNSTGNHLHLELWKGGKKANAVNPRGYIPVSYTHLLLREELPSEGKVTGLGKDVAQHSHQVPYLRRQMGIIFQDFRLIPTMTVYENVAFAMRVTNIPTKKDVYKRPLLDRHSSRTGQGR